MADLLEICRRAQQGPTVSEESFDLDCLYATLTRLVKKYDIKYDPDNPIPSDDALADKIFGAAVDFFAECGIYVRSTKTVVHFSRAEITEAVATYDGDCHFGEGKEARIFRSRKPDSSTRPWCHVGSGIVASSEEIASKIVQGNASIKAADSMSVNALDKIDGCNIVTGQPSEILGSIRSIKIARQACRQAGRPGLPIINGIATAGSALATIALLMVSEIDDIERFRSDRKLHAYAGLVPSTHSSAGRTFHGRIIKTGNKYIRWAMIEAVWPAIRSDTSLNNYFQRFSCRKGVNQAKVCTARRLLTIVYKVLKEKREYRYVA